MQACADDCDVPIPAHLHSKGKLRIAEVSIDDFFYLHHSPIPEGEPYGFSLSTHLRATNQSANSHLLNPDGQPTDVLYNIRTGDRIENQIACIAVSDLRTLCFPNPNKIKKNPDGTDVPPTESEQYSFKICHYPTPCMYPHCEIHTFEGGVKKKEVGSSSMKTLIRRAFAQLAEKYRSEMLKYTA